MLKPISKILSQQSDQNPCPPSLFLANLKSQQTLFGSTRVLVTFLPVMVMPLSTSKYPLLHQAKLWFFETSSHVGLDFPATLCLLPFWINFRWKSISFHRTHSGSCRSSFRSWEPSDAISAPMCLQDFLSWLLSQKL
jgi:hypothetical protein